MGASEDSHLLAGRIALEQGHLDVAEAHLSEAAAAGIDAQKLVPFRAEIAFFQGRYDAIPAQLATLPDEILQRPPFAALARYWL
ncbi:hypothetical protein D9M68_833010 [compost metagenome]